MFEQAGCCLSADILTDHVDASSPSLADNSASVIDSDPAVVLIDPPHPAAGIEREKTTRGCLLSISFLSLSSADNAQMVSSPPRLSLPSDLLGLAGVKRPDGILVPLKTS